MVNATASRLALLLGLLVLAGCESTPTRDPEFALVRPAPLPAPPPTSGAIYRVGHDVPLFTDRRAGRVGDILTIRLEERTVASKQADASASKQTGVGIDNPTVLGVPLELGTRNLETRLSSSQDFDGSSDASQRNSLTGDISVTVAEVLPNGDLVVQGEKILTLTAGHEHIRLSGVVRAADIGADNTVPSTRVAGARIIYAGEGQSQSATIMGWIARFFISALMPF